MNTFKVVIPARFASSRLPGKPLKLIAGKTMIEHVVDRAREAGAEQVIVATDDERIREVVEGFGGQVVMTAATHESGTDRLAEVASIMGWGDDDIIVNLQGDEPLMEPELLSLAANALVAHPQAGLSTIGTPIAHRHDVFDSNVVKVVTNQQGMALYFSRAAIPWVRGDFCQLPSGDGAMPDCVPIYRHLGLYAYRVGILKQITQWAPCALERSEALEQLRALWHGVGIHVSVIDHAPGHGVDTPADLERVERIMAERLKSA